MSILKPRIENQPSQEKSATKELPQAETELSVGEFQEIANNISRKVEFEADDRISKNATMGLRAIESLGGAQSHQQELKDRQGQIIAKIISLGGEYASKIKNEAGLDQSKDQAEPLSKKDLDKSESKLKKFVKAELNLASKVNPFAPMIRPAIRLMTEKKYRDYVIDKAPEVAPVLAKAIATKGASLKKPNDLKILIDFAINDPESPEFIKKWGNKILNSKEGQTILTKASKKMGKDKTAKPPALAA